MGIYERFSAEAPVMKNIFDAAAKSDAREGTDLRDKAKRATRKWHAAQLKAAVMAPQPSPAQVRQMLSKHYDFTFRGINPGNDARTVAEMAELRAREKEFACEQHGASEYEARRLREVSDAIVAKFAEKMQGKDDKYVYFMAMRTGYLAGEGFVKSLCEAAENKNAALVRRQPSASACLNA